MVSSNDSLSTCADLKPGEARHADFDPKTIKNIKDCAQRDILRDISRDILRDIVRDILRDIVRNIDPPTDKPNSQQSRFRSNLNA